MEYAKKEEQARLKEYGLARAKCIANKKKCIYRKDNPNLLGIREKDDSWQDEEKFEALNDAEEQRLEWEREELEEQKLFAERNISI